MIPKPRPRVLDRHDRKRTEEAFYRQQSALARVRDRNCCRVCSSAYRLETHHVERRSHFGPKQVADKHDKSNLLTVCADCHEMFTGNVLRAIATTAKGTDGPVQLTKYSDTEGGWVTYKAAA